ncbi:hypothetical protein AMS68_000068 [Peltaster fructicola]|uniref:Uncharacterized protein n=1 Tax=Peltaster fructicola TaxID=286661 RepID=A0A6H0XIU2_9PEZI|nr:hypothetical protein AMS68_000068 [Peltaster fructicola]
MLLESCHSHDRIFAFLNDIVLGNGGIMEDNDSSYTHIPPYHDSEDWPLSSIMQPAMSSDRKRRHSSSSNDSTMTQIFGHGQTYQAAEEEVTARAVSSTVGKPPGSTHYILGQHDLAGWDPATMYIGGVIPDRNTTPSNSGTDNSGTDKSIDSATPYNSPSTGITGVLTQTTPSPIVAHNAHYSRASIHSTDALLDTPTRSTTTTGQNTSGQLRSAVNNVYVPRNVAHRANTVASTRNIRENWRNISNTTAANASIMSGRAAAPGGVSFPIALSNPFMPRGLMQGSYASVAASANNAPQRSHATPTQASAGNAIVRNNDQTSSDARQLTRDDVLLGRSADELIAVIKSGSWDLPNGENGSPERSARSRLGRGLFSALGRRGVRAQGSAGPTATRLSTMVLAQRERDARALARIGRQLSAPAWFGSVQFQDVVPSVENLLKDMPFITPLGGHVVPDYGVIHIVEPPFHVTKAEILNLLGKSAQIKSQPIGTSYFAVHIMMDRNTGKTQDAFVEVSCHEEAATIAAHFSRREAEGRRLTLGNKPAQVKQSSNEEMMKAIFPFAKFVSWHGANPVVNYTPTQYYPGVVAARFDGFIGHDEAALMIKWLTEPGRSPFIARGPNRLYENVITLLHKYPVYASNLVSLKDRKRVYDIAFTAIKSLSTILREDNDVPLQARLDTRLLQELVIASLTFPLFTDAQKAEMVRELRIDGRFDGLVFNHGMQVALGGTHEHASRMPFCVLVRQPGIPDNFFKYYCNLIREQSNKTLAGLTYGEVQALVAARQNEHADEPFLAFRIDYGVSAEELGYMTLSDCAIMEFDALAKMLCAAISQDN